MKELWIANWEHLYSVTEDGEVFGYQRGKRKIKGQINNSGYLLVMLQRDYERWAVSVHRLVVQTFLGPSHGDVNHKDGNKLNNKVSNLEWCSHLENMRHGFKGGRFPLGEKQWQSKLEPKDIHFIRDNPKSYTNAQLARRYKVSPSCICKIRKRLAWKHL